VSVGHGIGAFKGVIAKAIAGGGAAVAKPQVADEATLAAGRSDHSSSAGLAVSVA
jgi:hypothetical protein